MAGVVRFLGLGALLAWVGLAAAQNKAGVGSANLSSSSVVSAKSEAVRTTALTGAAQGTAQQRGPRAPANDDCANAYAFDLYAGDPVTFYDDNTGATEDCAALSGGVYGEAWFKFTTVETLNVIIKYCGTSPAFGNGYIVMDTTCPCSGAFIFASSWEQDSCGDGNWSFYWNGLPAGTYYWPLLTSAAWTAEGPYTVTFDSTTPPPPPECPDGTMYGQNPMDQGGAWGAYTSAVTTQFSYKCFEDFSVSQSFFGLHWWGLSLYYDPYNGWQPCDPTGMTFDVEFYADDGGYPGTLVAMHPNIAPTITDVGPFSWAELYYFSIDTLQPCGPALSGWMSVQSQLNAPDCAFLWLNSPMGDLNSYQQPAGGTYGQLGTDLAFCIASECGGMPYGACCDDYTGVCTDMVEWGDCPPPLRFTIDTLCADLAPTCGIRGACCAAGNCVFTGFEAACDAIGGRFFPDQTCPEFVCFDDWCERIDLYDCYGDGWNGNTLDVLVNGVTVLSGITLPSGLGPLSFNILAATGDTIQTIYYPIGGWPYEPYYFIYDLFGCLLGQDGIVGADCYVQPTGITVIGNCAPPTTGACCYYAGGCDITTPDQCFNGEFLGLCTICSQCPCYVPCPPGSSQEPEPCGQDTDGGCGLDPPAFAPIACGETICGTTWANTSLRDTDWYQLTTAYDGNYTWTVEAEVPLLIFIFKGAGPDNCAFYTTLASATASECTPVSLNTGLVGPGTYWFWAGPSAWSDWPCVRDYTASLTCAEFPGACCWNDAVCTQEYPSTCGGFYGGSFTECSGLDCNLNTVDDFCDIASGYSTDCDGNGVPDECQPQDDCDGNGVADFCDIASGDSQDCNGNGIPDECDIANGTSLDCQPDGTPDECQVAPGCGWQIDDGSSENAWGLPDGGELCWMNHMFTPSWEVVAHVAACFGSPWSPGASGVAPGQVFRVYVWSDPNQDGSPVDAVFLGEATGTADAGSIDTDVLQMVTISPPIAVNGSFFIGASVVTATGGSPAPADDDGWTGPPDQGFLTFNSVPFDPSSIAANLYPMSALGYPLTVFLLRGTGAFSSDCNGNGVPDECDVPPICQGPDCSFDCNGNLIPDECEPDCNGNGRLDECDIASGYSQDCNGNGIPDECDLADGTSQDCNDNGVPDECDLASGYSQDCNQNGIPDECDIADCPPGEMWCCDCQGDGIPDECQLWGGGGGWGWPSSWDDGSSENSLGLTAGGELCWLHHFAWNYPGWIWSIQTCFGTPVYPGSSGVSAGQPFRVYVWNDPNGDGHPSDAVFVGESTGVVGGASIDSDVFQTVVINRPVNASFFVGASVVTTGGYPAPMDENGTQHNEAWVTFNTVPFDPTDLATLYNMTDIGYPCNWLLRANSDYGCVPNDCNANGIPDECDIGTAWDGYCAGQGGCWPTECDSDWNYNGVPDHCPFERCGDLDSDGNVDFDDYWIFVDTFGTCAGDPKYLPAADLDGDGCVTLLDYRAWRMCYKMANGKDFVVPKPQPMPAPEPQTPQGGVAR